MVYALLHRTAVLLMTLGAGTTRTTAVRLTDVQTISGRVTDLAGNPAAQIVVRPRGSGGPRSCSGARSPSFSM